jgi:hypothetical protein
VGVRSHGESIGKCIAFFDEDLVAYAATCGVEIDALFFCKAFDVAVFLEILV